MRNLFSANMGMEAIIRPKFKETLQPGALQPKERTNADFQKMLNTVSDRRPATKNPENQITTQKPEPLNPENHLTRPLKSKSSNRAPVANAKEAINFDEAKNELPDSESGKTVAQSEEDPALAVAVQESTNFNPLNMLQNAADGAVASGTPTGSAGQTAILDPTLTQLPMPALAPTLASTLTQSSTPLLTPTLKIAKSAFAGLNAQLEGTAPAGDMTANSLLPEFNPELQVANQADASFLNGVTASQTDLTEDGTPVLGRLVIPEVVAPTVGMAIDTVTEAVNVPNPGIDPVKAEALPKMAPPTDFQNLLVTTQAATGRSQPEVGAPNMENSNTVAATIAAATPDSKASSGRLNSGFNYNTVMAGISLQANKGMTPENASPLPALSVLSVPAGMIVKTTNHGGQNDPEPMNDFNGGPQAPINLFAQRAATPGQLLNGTTENAARENPGQNGQAAGESADFPLQIAAISGNINKEATVAVGETKSSSLASATLTKRPPDISTGVELSGAGGVNTTDTVTHAQQTVNQQEGTPVNKGELFSQIVEQAKVMVHEGQSTMELSLKPEHLGKLKMRIAVEHQMVTAHFTVESEQVKQIIETNLVQLRKMLQDAGAQIQNLNVSIGQHHNGDANYSQQSFSGGSGNQAPRQSTSEGTVSEASHHPTVNHVPVKSQTVVDLIA
jgi:flagellar hook-length control protein FliK